MIYHSMRRGSRKNTGRGILPRLIERQLHCIVEEIAREQQTQARAFMYMFSTPSGMDTKKNLFSGDD